MALTTAEVAEALETNGRTLRKFLRAKAKEAGGTVGVDTPGKGKRYSFEKKEVNGLRKQFAAWQEAQAKRAAERAEKEAADETEVSEEDAELEV